MLIEINFHADGDRTCALVGTDLQSGVAGFGVTLPDALADLATNLKGAVLTSEQCQPLTRQLREACEFTLKFQKNLGAVTEGVLRGAVEAVNEAVRVYPDELRRLSAAVEAQKEGFDEAIAKAFPGP